MNQEKIGKFITKCRQDRKLTQDELAKEIGVTDKAISKWENGRCLPDVSLFKTLCDSLNISINELLNGEKDTIDHNEEGYIKYVGYNNKKNKIKILITAIILLITIVFFLIGIYFINNYGKITIYKLYGESDNFSYQNALLIISNDKNILVSGDILSNNEIVNTKDIASVELKSNNKLIIGGLGRINIEDNGYNEIFTKEKINNLDNWYIEITYIKEGKEITETLRVKNELVLKNTKFFEKKTLSIGNNTDENYEDQEKYENSDEEAEKIKQNLLKKGYKEYKIYYQVKKELNNNTIIINTKTNYARFHSNNAYGEDGIDLRLNSEYNYRNQIQIEKTKNKVYYSALYDINSKEIKCLTDNCDIKELRDDCQKFYNFIQDEIKK